MLVRGFGRCAVLDGHACTLLHTDVYLFMVTLHAVVTSFFFFSSPNLSGRRLDVYHTSAHGVALVYI